MPAGDNPARLHWQISTLFGNGIAVVIQHRALGAKREAAEGVKDGTWTEPEKRPQNLSHAWFIQRGLCLMPLGALLIGVGDVEDAAFT